MTEEKRVYKIFISSPGGLEHERAVAKTVIDTLSESYDRRTGVLLKAWMWEHDAVTEIGTNAQQSITAQLGDYDIYLGMMGSKFGTPTTNFGSGTEEEFSGAFDSFVAQSRPKIGFFFKNETLHSTKLSAHDLIQLGKVQDFKERLQPNGLYHIFTEDYELSNQINAFISKVIDDALRDDSVNQVQYLLGPLAVGEVRPTLSKDFYKIILNAVDDNIRNDGTSLSLDEIWIEPELKENSDEAKDSSPQAEYKFSRLAKELSEGKSKLIIGGETSGKSSICKRVYLELIAAGFYPVLIQGDRINNLDLDRFLARIKIAYNEQYDNISQLLDDNFFCAKGILIIDDYDMGRLAASKVSRLILSAHSLFRAIAMTTLSSHSFQFLEGVDEAGLLGAFEKVYVGDLGNASRYKLIERWCIRSGVISNDTDLRYLVENKRKIVNRILISNLVPRTPVIILILLQAMDSGQSGDLAKSGYVRYYKFLIDGVILKSGSPRDAEAAYALLPEIAWKMFCASTVELSRSDVRTLVDNLANERALRAEFLYSGLSSISNTGLLDENAGHLKFRYKYVYYFFLAEYISKRLSESATQGLLEKLCRQIRDKDSANILVFLAFHTDSNVIVQTLLQELNSFYHNGTEFEFSPDRTVAVNRLIFDAPRLVIDHSSINKNRERRLQAEDKNTPELSSSENRGIMADFENVFTAIEILGHIIRNHYAQMDATIKREIVIGSFKGSMRCAGAIFDYLSQSVDILTKAIRSYRKHDVDDSDGKKQEKSIQKAIFYLATLLIFYAAKQLVRSIGDENLEVTYSQVLAENPSVTAELIDIAIKLDSFRDFPDKELKSISEKLSDSHIGMTALRFMVAERLDMRPPESHADLQKYCDMVGLELRPRLLAQRTKI